MRPFLIATLLVLSTSNHLVSAQQPKVAIFVGPQIRDGFADIDSGIRDSIRDIQDEVWFHRELELSPTKEGATIWLTVLARGIVTDGSRGLWSAAGGGVVMPNTKPTLTTVLGTGRYERRMQSEGGNWRDAAKAAVNDVIVWLEANRKMLAP